MGPISLPVIFGTVIAGVLAVAVAYIVLLDPPDKEAEIVQLGCDLDEDCVLVRLSCLECGIAMHIDQTKQRPDLQCGGRERTCPKQIVRCDHNTCVGETKQQIVPQTKKTCAEQGGIWNDFCNLQSSDAGKVCTDSSQCEGICLSPGVCDGWLRVKEKCFTPMINGFEGARLCTGT